MPKAKTVIMKVIGILIDAGNISMASIGRIAPSVKETADEIAACQGFANSSESIEYRALTWSPIGSIEVYSSATFFAVSGDNPLDS